MILGLASIVFLIVGAVHQANKGERNEEENIDI